MKQGYGPPKRRHTLVDFARKAIAYIALKFHGRDLRRMAPRGDGSPVLVLPGIMNNDLWTRPLREFLRDQGYRVYGWNGGMNTGFSDATAQHLKKRLHEIFRDSGGRKVALVGHSLGGLYAHELAQEFPDQVSKVITLSAAINLDATLGAVARPVRAVFNAMSGATALLKNEAAFSRLLLPPAVPATAIYTRTDGIVNWRACLHPASGLTENIEVRTSHSGMIISRAAFLAVADRLAQKDGEWRPFDAARYPGYRDGPKLYDGPVPDMPTPESIRNAPRIFSD